ncbi:hypothetical protein NWO25_16375 [Enterococcus lactis]|nr:hypothetical protein [Enterococcus lactis]
MSKEKYYLEGVLGENENFNNIDERVVDDLKRTKSTEQVKDCCSIIFNLCVRGVKKELEKVDQIQFLFTSDLFTKEKAPKEKREFFIPRLNRESQLYGNEFELRMRNELSQRLSLKKLQNGFVKKLRLSQIFLGNVLIILWSWKIKEI